MSVLVGACHCLQTAGAMAGSLGWKILRELTELAEDDRRGSGKRYYEKSNGASFDLNI